MAVKRGRPAVTEKVTLEVGDKKVTVSYIEEDNRVQISLPSEWAIASMGAFAGRKRIDLVSLGESAPAPAKKAPKKKAAPAAKKEKEEENLPPNKSGQPAKPARRSRRKVAA